MGSVFSKINIVMEFMIVLMDTMKYLNVQGVKIRVCSFVLQVEDVYKKMNAVMVFKIVRMLMMKNTIALVVLQVHSNAN